jgi:hypothetical protein
MENVVPGTLQRLRAADIIRMAGLAVASLGQEYCRTGAVHSAKRQGTRLSGVVEVLHPASVAGGVAEVPAAEKNQRHYPVVIEIQSASAWVSTCPCGQNTSTLCAHGAALLYQWLVRPASFLSPVPPSGSGRVLSQQHTATEESVQERDATPKSARPFASPKQLLLQGGLTPLGSLVDILAQLGLSELRGIAREYEVATNSMNKQQLAEAIQQALSQPELVRRVATTLEKSQRQLLAALTLAGGSITDDDLRGLFERFSLGQPNQLQNTLLALQGKAMLFRTSLNSPSQQRIGLSGSLLDIGWYVPTEVRAALRVMVPVTPFNVQPDDDSSEVPVIEQTRTYSLLADLLLVARSLDGYRLSHDDEWLEHGTLGRVADSYAFVRSNSTLSVDGSVPIPPPGDTPSEALLALVQSSIKRPSAFLHFAIRLLHLADILHKDDSGTPYLRVLPNTAQLLLGPSRLDAVRDLFELWLTQSSYAELFNIQDDGLRLRCRATSLNIPVLRPGELDAENSEARMSLVALLAQAPLNQWISFTAFARFVYRLNPAFLQKRQRLFSSPHWWLEQEEGRPLRPLQLGDWLRAEIYYLARFLYGPLHWWGACDIALSRDGRLLAFRLTPLADWLFNGRELNEEPATHNYHNLSNSLEIVDNEELLVSCSPVAWPLIELMETFTEAAGVSQGRLRYRLTPKALGEALSRGRCPTALVELLRSVAEPRTADNGSLANMLEQLERWIASYGRVRIYTGVTLLETADAMVMRELSATTSLDKHIVRTIHPTLHILKMPGTERILDDLKRRGQSPLVHDEELYGTE